MEAVREDPRSRQAGQRPGQRQQSQGRGDGKTVTTEGLEWKPNPFDEYAVETALRLNENAKGTEKLGEIIVVTLRSEGCRSDPASGARDGCRPRHPRRSRRRQARLARRGARAQGDRREGKARRRAAGQAGRRRRLQRHRPDPRRAARLAAWRRSPCRIKTTRRRQDADGGSRSRHRRAHRQGADARPSSPSTCASCRPRPCRTA